MARMVALGAALQDIYFVDRDDFAGDSHFSQLAIGSKVDIDRVRYFAGGGGTNTAVTFARSGHTTYFIGNFGGDHAGEMVKGELEKEGVDLDFACTLPRKTTGTSAVLLDQKSGERTILTYRGASAEFGNLDPNALTAIRPDWACFTTFRGDFATLRRFFVCAKKVGAQIMFNPGVLELKNPRETLALLKFVDILLLNREEATQLVTGESPVELLLRLKNYVPTVIITNNCLGAVAMTEMRKAGRTVRRGYQLPIYAPVRPKDTTGAGDAFGSGVLATLARGKSFRQSLIFGSANSWHVIQKLGAKAGILRADAELHPMLIAPIKEEK